MYTRILYIVIIVLAVLSGVLVYKDTSLRDRLSSAEGQVVSLADNLEMTTGQFNVVVAYALRDQIRNKRPITNSEFVQLEMARNYYRELLNKDQPRDLPLTVRIDATRLVAQISMSQSRFAEAEAYYREALELLADIDEKLAHLAFVRAETTTQFAYLLSSTDRLHEAESVALDARAQFESLVVRNPTIPHRTGLAISHLNLAFLHSIAEQDSLALRNFKDAIALLSGILGESPESDSIHERLIDAQQYAVGLNVKLRRWQAAHDICQSSLQSLAALSDAYISLNSYSRELAVSTTQAARNLSAIERQMSAELESDTSPEPQDVSWRWDPLFSSDGLTFEPDILVKGRVSAEFEHHDVLALSFTRQHQQWWLPTLTMLARELAGHVQILVLVPDLAAQQEIVRALRVAKIDTANIIFWPIEADTIWLRDYGPIQVHSQGGMHWIDAINGIGIVDRPRTLDEAVPTAMAHRSGVRPVRVPLRLTGGNILSNGDGLCICTTDMIDRDTHLGHQASHITKTIKRLFGADEVLYLEPLSGEQTGHVDWFATFVTADTVVVGEYGDEEDPVNAAILDRNAATLARAKLRSGPLNVVRIPMPPREQDFFGGTFTNVIFANGVLVVPTWSDTETDAEIRAIEIYKRLLPEWKIVRVNSELLGRNNGSLRCASLQLHWPDK